MVIDKNFKGEMKDKIKVGYIGIGRRGKNILKNVKLIKYSVASVVSSAINLVKGFFKK